jgi:hypothetical protein
MDLLQGLEDSVAQSFSAFDAQLTAFTGLACVEGVADQRIGQSGRGPMSIDLGLGPLHLQLIEDPGQFRGLALVEAELVNEKA